MPHEYCASCSVDWDDKENKKLGCMKYQDVEGWTYEDCEKQLFDLGWTEDEELGWICPEHSKK